MSEVVKDTLRSAIFNLSEKYNIQKNELRIKVSRPEKKMVYQIMKNKEIVDTTNIGTALNLGTGKAFLVGMKLESLIGDLSKHYQIPLNSINVRIYTKTEDCEPLLYIFDDKTPKVQLQEEDIKQLI